MRSSFDIGGIPFGGGAGIVLIAGPCVLESEGLADEVCGRVKELAAGFGIGYVFKSSYDKANRQDIDSFRRGSKRASPCSGVSARVTASPC